MSQAGPENIKFGIDQLLNEIDKCKQQLERLAHLKALSIELRSELKLCFDFMCFSEMEWEINRNLGKLRNHLAELRGE